MSFAHKSHGAVYGRVRGCCHIELGSTGLLCFALQFSSSYPHLDRVNSSDIMMKYVTLNIMKNICKWYQFNDLSCNFVLFINKLYFPNNVFCFLYLHSYFIICKNILSLPFLFFPSSSSFSSFHFFLSSFSSFFFLFPNLHHFLFFFSHFLGAPLPCSRTFLLLFFWHGNNLAYVCALCCTVYLTLSFCKMCISILCTTFHSWTQLR